MTEPGSEKSFIDEEDDDNEDTPLLEPKSKRDFVAISSVSEELVKETKRKNEEIKKSPIFLEALRKAKIQDLIDQEQAKIENCRARIEELKKELKKENQAN